MSSEIQIYTSRFTLLRNHPNKTAYICVASDPQSRLGPASAPRGPESAGESAHDLHGEEQSRVRHSLKPDQDP